MAMRLTAPDNAGTIGTLACLAVLMAHSVMWAAESEVVRPDQLFKTGKLLANRTHYLEALDLFDEARDLLEKNGTTETRLYADVLFSSARAKIKGRLHQHFSALFVKMALKEIQASNMLREKLSGVPPQELAEGYFLEGVIHKRFFMRKREALDCFRRAVEIDPGNYPAKREWSELIAEENRK